MSPAESTAASAASAESAASVAEPASGAESASGAEHNGAANNRAADRLRRLASGVAALRVRGGGRLNLERVLLVVGSILLPLGAILILLGWYGAAHTARQFEQIDYLISGGVLGVALVVAGGFFYFGFWLTRQLHEERRHNDRLVAALDRIESRLAGVEAAATAPTPPRAVSAASSASSGRPAGSVRVSTRVGALSRTPARSAGGPAPTNPVAWAVGSLVATPNGTMFHRPDCPVVANKEGLRSVQADAAGFRPCRICDPLAAD